MPYQLIDIGTVANDGTGDNARIWAQKNNTNAAYFQALIDAISGTVTVSGNQANLLKAPNNVNNAVIEVGDRVLVFGNATTILTLLYTNVLADADTDNIGTTPNWDNGNYTPLAIQETT